MTYQLVTLVLGLVAIACAWDVARRFAGSKDAALAARLAQLTADVNTLKAARDEEGAAARLEALEAQARGIKSHLETMRSQRPWGSVRARAGS